MHGVQYIASDKTHRICHLDVGHDGPCAGPIARAFRKALKDAAHARQDAIEAALPSAPPIVGNLSPSEFAQEILAAARHGADFKTIASVIVAKYGSGVRANGVPISAREVRQMAHRLQRDGRATVTGSAVVA